MRRAKRIAVAQSKSVPEVIEDAVLEYWVRFATRAKLAHREW
jgi:hypothetical protein